MNRLIYKTVTIDDDKIISLDFYGADPLKSDVIEIGTLSAEILLENKSDADEIMSFSKGEKLLFEKDGRPVSVYFIEKVERSGKFTYQLSAYNAVSFLDADKHFGGIYTGQTVADVVKDICGPVPVIVKSDIENVPVNGYLPIATRRENLAQILFALWATVKQDLNGVLHVEGLWDGISGYAGEDAMYEGGTVKYASPVSKVSVTEHQYIRGTTEKTLFEGSTVSGDTITFSAPYHSLKAEGFQILESGANYAKISAGSGNLTGVEYIHNTRTVSADVSEASDNVKTVTNATLVSVLNSRTVAARLAEYYKHSQTIRADIDYKASKPGDRVIVRDPYEEVDKYACLKSVDVSVFGLMNSEIEALVGYVPPNISGEDRRSERLTGSGVWESPIDGVVTAVIIGGGQGGAPGKDGQALEEQPEKTDEVSLTESITTTKGRLPMAGGEGGDPGKGGSSGKVFSVDIQVKKGDQFQYSCGIGGEGADVGEEYGQLGTASTFGAFSSDSGAVLTGGFVDETTQEVVAETGKDGYKGGSGGGRIYEEETGYQPPTVAENVVVDGVTYKGGANKNDTEITDQGGSYQDGTYGSTSAYSGGGYGGGAAYGANGSDGKTAQDSGTAQADSASASSKPAQGGNGANALPLPNQTVIGSGGPGGNGGGGPGSAGFAYSENRRRKSSSQQPATLRTSAATPATPGKGSPGSKGGPGGIFLYYSIPKQYVGGGVIDKNGKFVLDKYGRLLVR